MTIRFELESNAARGRRILQERIKASDTKLAEARRVERQRTLMAMLPDTRSVDALKQGMLDRARDLLRGDGDDDTRAARALLEFLPSRDVECLLREVFPEE